MQTNKFDHVDSFIDTHPFGEIIALEPEINYARFVLNLMRLPAGMQMDFEPYTKDLKLFCNCSLEEFKDQKVQVVFASRMGWVGIRKLNSNYHSYENQVPISTCFNWTNK